MAARGPAFVGRVAEAGVLRDAWRQTADGRGPRVIAVQGPPGIGKSALVERLATELAGGPAPLVVALSAERVGFPQPWRLLTDLVDRLAELAGPGAELPGAPGAFANAHLVADGLAGALRRPGGTVVLVDDAQHADVTSLATIRRAAAAVDDEPLLLVFVHQDADSLTRPADALPDAPPDGPREAAVWLEHECAVDERIRLGGLAVADLLDLARAMGRPLSVRAAVRLHEHTEGHPFAWQLVDQLSSADLVGATGPLGAPADVARIVAARLAALPAGARGVVEAAAVLGRRFGVADLHELCPDQDVGEALDAAMAAGLVEEEPGRSGRRLRFASSLVRDAAYNQLPRRQRQRLHRAAVLLGPEGAAWHRVASADGPDPALADILADMARDEYRRGHLHLCAQYNEQSLEFTPRAGPDRPARLLHTVELMLLVGNLGRATALEPQLGTCPPGPWRDYVAGYLHMLRGRPEQAQELLMGAHAALSGPDAVRDPGAPGDLRARVCGAIATLGIVSLSYSEVSAYAKEALDGTAEDSVVASLAYFCRAVGLALTGRSRDALAELDSSRAFVTGTGLEALVARGMLRLWTDDLPGADEDLSRALQRAVAGESLRVGQGLAYLGELRFRRGELAEAARIGGWAIDDAMQNERFWDFAMAHGLACYPHAAMGDWDRAEELARLAGTYAWTATGKAYAAGARAALAQARDDAGLLLQAGEEMQVAYDAKESGVSLFGALTADALSRLHRPDDALAALEPFEARFGGTGARSAEMGIARVRAQIALERGEPGCADELAGRALEHAEGIGLPLEAGRIRLVRARARHAAGRPHAAERELTVAMAAFSRMGAAAYVEQVHRLAAELDLPVGLDPLRVLTRAERGIVELDLRGLSNAEIAAELTLAPKTVENKLRDARRKLQVGTLDEVREAVDAV
jgi:DNA-binding CsgD family transcriptional regulator